MKIASFYSGGIISPVDEGSAIFTETFDAGHFQLDTSTFVAEIEARGVPHRKRPIEIPRKMPPEDERPARKPPADELPPLPTDAIDLSRMEPAEFEALPAAKLLHVPGSAPVTVFALQLGLEQLIVRKRTVHATVRGATVHLGVDEIFSRLHKSDVDVTMEWFEGDSLKSHKVETHTNTVELHPRLGVCRLSHFETMARSGASEVVAKFVETNGLQPSDALLKDIQRALRRMSRDARAGEYGFIYIAPAVHTLEPAAAGRWLIRPVRAEYHPISEKDAERFGFEFHRSDFEVGAERNLPFQGRRVFCELVDLDLVDPASETAGRGRFSLAGIGLAPTTQWEELMFGGRFTAQARSAETAGNSKHVTMLRQALVQIGRMRADGTAEVYDIFSTSAGETSHLAIDGYVEYDRFTNVRLNAGAVEAVRHFEELIHAVKYARLVRRRETVARSADRRWRHDLTRRLKLDFEPRLPETIDPANVVYGLAEEFSHFVTADRIASLEAALKAAQTSPPDDKKSFVRAANRLLDVFGLKVQADDGELYRLHVVPGRKPGVEFLAMLGGGGAKRGRGFMNVAFQLVPDPMKPKAGELAPIPEA